MVTRCIRGVAIVFLDNTEISTPCPLCDFENPFTLKQARLRDIIICRGCKANIQLDDQMNECKNAVRRTERMISELQSSLKNMNFKFEL